MFPRFLRPIPPASQRAYSFFSKQGGGRYFNSSKPPKVVPHANTKAIVRVDAGAGEATASAKVADDVAPSSSSSPPQPAVADTPAPTPLPTPSQAFARPSYPSLTAHDLRLHQFFALHRPLVLTQPATALFEASPAFDPAAPRRAAPAEQQTSVLDDPPEASPEADADAARQLARALVMNTVGGAVQFEDALRRLGLDLSVGRESVTDVSELQVDMDSTKRKRRKKMKKHKLKKRRKASRAERLKIGR
ncbi:hypothetical protein BV25DRAFT_1842312 [Artomyces pyxidatus]|uniref:Uncharacterized protein n=1 Tax=Artomyces pyxidatus TaxID=48021 RepID=A0ACB8SKR4_9AGAM|nr:hypothetical protein BV25DRAFT_1842312 [Artomyces pyxidatus]